MMQVYHSPYALDRGFIAVLALNTLTRQQCATVADMLPVGVGAWSVATHVDYDGYQSVLVSDGQSGKEYIFHGTVDRIELSLIADEQLWPLGIFRRMEAAITRLLEVAAAGVRPVTPCQDS